MLREVFPQKKIRAFLITNRDFAETLSENAPMVM